MPYDQYDNPMILVVVMIGLAIATAVDALIQKYRRSRPGGPPETHHW